MSPLQIIFAGADGGFSSIEAVRALFQSDALLVAGWLHYLAFDLFVGAWEVRTARAAGIPHLLVIPCLALTFLFGPLGFLAFLILRAACKHAVAFRAIDPFALRMNLMSESVFVSPAHHGRRRFVARGRMAFAAACPAYFLASLHLIRRFMANVTFTVGGESGADVVFYFFGPNSGDVQSNATRWMKQFESKEGTEKTETLDAGGSKITLVSTEGTFNRGMPGGPTTPMKDYALLGAILESPEGLVFVKMTGPAELVKSKRTQFIDFVTAAVKAAK